MKRIARMEIRIGGSGGQGLILSAKMAADALAASGWHVAQSQTYEPTSRGGFCNSDLVLSKQEVDYPLTTALDYLVLLDRTAVKPSWPLLKAGALVIADTRLVPEIPDSVEGKSYRAMRLPLSRTAIELGSERVANMVALGVLVATAELCDRKTLEDAVRSETPKSFLDLNMDALAAGFRLAAEATAAAAS